MSYLYDHMQRDGSPLRAALCPARTKSAEAGAKPVKQVGDATKKTKSTGKKKKVKSGLPDNLDAGYEALTTGPLRLGSKQLAKQAQAPLNRLKTVLGALGIGGTAAGGGAYYMSRPYEGDPDVSRWSMMRTRRALSSALDRLRKGDSDMKVETGMHRQVVPMDKINEKALKHLDYVPSVVAIPERGQSQLTSYRRIPDASDPGFNPHIHKHDKNWFLHNDKHPSLTLALQHAKTNEERLQALRSGMQHVLGEGLPGAASYISNLIKGSPTFEQRVHHGLFDYITDDERGLLTNPAPSILSKSGAWNKIIPAVATKAKPAPREQVDTILDMLKAKFQLKAEAPRATGKPVKLPERTLLDKERMKQEWIRMTPEEQAASLKQN